MMVIVNTIVLTDRQKKQTVAVSDVQASGQLASFYLSRDLRMAGYGMTRETFTNCQVLAYDALRTTNFTFSLAPVRITSGGTGGLQSDTLSLMYGNADVTTTAIKLQASDNGTLANLQVDNRYGFRNGDKFVMFSSSVDTNADTIADCSMGEVTGLPSTSGQTNQIVRTTNSYVNNYSGVSTTPRYNKSGGLGISYPVGTQVFNLGPAPVSYTYAVAANNILRRTNTITGESIDLGDNVVAIKFYYLKDTNLDGVADTLDQSAPASADGWKQVLAIRYAVITRSTATVEDPISTLTIVPSITLPNASVQSAIVAPITGTDRFYRYRVYGSTVALRNIIWRDS